MTTKALFIASLGAKIAIPPEKEFVRTSGNILTAAAHGLATGAGPFKVMSTSGNDPPSGLTAAQRSSTFATGSTVVATDDLIVDGKTYTFIATPAADGDVDVGASDVASMENLARAINLGPGAGTDYDIDTVGNPNVTAEARGATVVLTAKTLDAAVGDLIGVTSADLTVDNATLQGGVDGVDYYIIRLDDGTFSLALTKAAALAGTVVALSDAGTGVHTLVATSETLAESLDDVLLQRLTHIGTRVLPQDQGVASFWQAAINGVASAVS